MCVITRLRVWRDRFILINSRYLRCRFSVTCFNLDKPQEMRPLRVFFKRLGRILGCPVVPYTIRLYTKNLIVYWDVRLFHILLNGSLTHGFLLFESCFSCFYFNPILITVRASICNTLLWKFVILITSFTSSLTLTYFS